MKKCKISLNLWSRDTNFAVTGTKSSHFLIRRLKYLRNAADIYKDSRKFSKRRDNNPEQNIILVTKNIRFFNKKFTSFPRK